MRIALTGVTGFIGRYLAAQLAEQGHILRCWYRASSNREGFDQIAEIEWLEGELGDGEHSARLVEDCDAVVHAALYRPGAGFGGAEGDVVEFAEKNVLGSLKLMEAARRAGVSRFVFVSTCAVHEKILDDRPLDETHPLWPKTHYGAYKAAVEKFVHSYGLGQGFSACALRPTGVYGVANPIENSKWYDLIAAVVRGERVECSGGGKEVHAADVAKAVGILVKADRVTAEAFSCYDRYVSNFEVASLAKELSGSDSEIIGQRKQPKHQIVTEKLRALGMQFGGEKLLRQTVQQLVAAVRR